MDEICGTGRCLCIGEGGEEGGLEKLMQASQRKHKPNVVNKLETDVNVFKKRKNKNIRFKKTVSTKRITDEKSTK